MKNKIVSQIDPAVASDPDPLSGYTNYLYKHQKDPVEFKGSRLSEANRLLLVNSGRNILKDAVSDNDYNAFVEKFKEMLERVISNLTPSGGKFEASEISVSHHNRMMEAYFSELGASSVFALFKVLSDLFDQGTLSIMAGADESSVNFFMAAFLKYTATLNKTEPIEWRQDDPLGKIDLPYT